MQATLTRLLIQRIARELLERRCEHVAVGALSPIPSAAALLAATLQPDLRVSLLGSDKHSLFTDGGRELFDCAAQGRIDAFFLSGVQIDASANINLIGTGTYPLLDKRYSGSFGSAFLYHVIPTVILFCWSHTPEVLVPEVDFITAAGPRDDGVWRAGGPSMLITNRCVFEFSAEDGFVLQSVHAGETLDSVRAATGFDFSVAGTTVNTTVSTPTSNVTGTIVDTSGIANDSGLNPGSTDVDTLLHETVMPELAALYPRFVERYLTNSAAPPRNVS